jgi:hypothetical protein
MITALKKLYEEHALGNASTRQSAFEGSGRSEPDLDAVGCLAVAREKAPMDEVIDDQGGDRDRDVRDPAPETLAVARLLRRGGRAPRRARSPAARSVGSTREASPRDVFRASGEVFKQSNSIGVAREPRGGDKQSRYGAIG